VCAHNPNIYTEIYADGSCKPCDRERGLRYAKRRRLAMALLHAAEARELTGGEAIALIQNADYRTLQECQTRGIHGG
jgi:hypothetical protein